MPSPSMEKVSMIGLICDRADTALSFPRISSFEIRTEASGLFILQIEGFDHADAGQHFRQQTGLADGGLETDRRRRPRLLAQGRDRDQTQGRQQQRGDGQFPIDLHKRDGNAEHARTALSLNP